MHKRDGGRVQQQRTGGVQRPIRGQHRHGAARGRVLGVILARLQAAAHITSHSIWHCIGHTYNLQLGFPLLSPANNTDRSCEALA